MSPGRFNARILLVAVASLAGLLLVAEVSFRLIAGERLLYRSDAALEYAPQPSQSVLQRGVRFETNEQGMRSPAVPRQKPDDVFRVIVLGDSVVFGHTNINQADLATTHLSTLALSDGRKIETLNVSAPSWGPGNLLAWIEANGLLAADTAIIVLSSHDLDDNRSFAAVDRSIYPQRQPLFALGDWIIRQLGALDEEKSPDPRPSGDARRSLPVLLRRLAEAPSGACLVVHSTTDELLSLTPSDGAAELREVAVAAGLDVVHARDLISSSDYIDNIHLSEEGQADLAKAMVACPALSGGPTRG